MWLWKEKQKLDSEVGGRWMFFQVSQVMQNSTTDPPSRLVVHSFRLYISHVACNKIVVTASEFLQILEAP